MNRRKNDLIMPESSSFGQLSSLSSLNNIFILFCRTTDIWVTFKLSNQLLNSTIRTFSKKSPNLFIFCMVFRMDLLFFSVGSSHKIKFVSQNRTSTTPKVIIVFIVSVLSIIFVFTHIIFIGICTKLHSFNERNTYMYVKPCY